MSRSAQPEVRNPLVRLPTAQRVRELPPEARAALRALMVDLKKECNARAEKAWRQRKRQMAAYWGTNAVYAGHIASLLPRGRS